MPPETDNLRLEDLFNADQKERAQILSSSAAVEALKQSDLARRKEVREMMARGEVNTAADLYRAGVIFLHGAAPNDFLTAHRLAAMAALNGHRSARWLLAASLDRFLMSIGLPQVYGTQFERNEEENRYQLRLPIDDASVLHFEKRFFDVPSVIERLTQLNRRIQN
ncbi:MAG TPA: hypothetical protein DCZ01_06310 [Elusimicrobia bacterium]|nr:MAG: hypothetical protein A2X37_11065 [Elusimicrobia bacterium GWA2_66_18]HAZ08127.1 hypothetical protein [Elusimicrobiota bacterium]